MKPKNEINAGPHRGVTSLKQSTRSAPARTSGLVLTVGIALCAGPASVRAQVWDTVDDILPPASSKGITSDSTGNIFVAGTIKDATGRDHAVITKSSDGGATWDTSAEFPSVSDAGAPNGSAAGFSAIASAQIASGEAHIVAAGAIKRVPFGSTFTTQWLTIRSRNAGVTWETMDEFAHPSYSQLGRLPGGVAVDNAGNIYVAGSALQSITAKGKTSTVYHWLIRKGLATANNGMTWSTVGDFTDPVSANPTAVACVGNDVFVAGSAGPSWIVRKSSNGGSTWQVVDTFRFSATNNSTAFGMAEDSEGNVFVAGEGKQTVTTGSGKNSVTVTTPYWITRKGTAAGSSWATVDQYLYPVAGGRAGAYAVTVDRNNDVHVTGYGSSATTPSRWITRQRSAATGWWETTEDFFAASKGNAEGRAIIADPFGKVFAAGVATDPPDTNYGWLVRRNSDTTATDAWVQQPVQGTAPAGRRDHSTVWTGTEMIVWGGIGPSNTGDRYNPANNTWTPVSTVGAPAPRYYHTAVWTGTEMIVWGGYRGGPGGHYNDGGRYNPVTDTWTPVTLVGAPAGRRDHTSVWTGSEMLVWGGNSSSSAGGRYNPATDSWVAMTTTGAPSAPREYFTGVWTGTEMIVWGGTSGYSYPGYPPLKTGGRYNPANDSWAPVTTNGAPAARLHQTAVWTGSEMIVWGGTNYNGTTQYFGDGGRYQPATDSWTPLPVAGAPSARTDHAAVWTGSEMILWGGSAGTGDLSNGSRYNPAANRWKAVTTFAAPPASSNHSTVWTGSEMIEWVGCSSINYSYIPD